MLDAELPNTINPMSRQTTFWQGLGLGLHRIILALFTFLSFGQQILVPLWFGILSFIGQWYIFKSFSRMYPGSSIYLLLVVSLLPLVAFWSASITKEAYMLLSMGLILYHSIVYRHGEARTLNYLGLALGFILLFLVRNFYIFSLLPFYIFWLLMPRESRYIPWFYVGFLLIMTGAFVASSYLPTSSALNVYQRVVERQAEFMSYGPSATTMYIPVMQAHGQNLYEVISTAFKNVFLRPLWSDILKPDQALYYFANTASWVLVLLSLWGIKKRDLYRSFFWFVITFSLANMTFIGVSVTAYGAICRYKMIFHLLLLLPFFAILYRRIDSRITD